MRKGVFTDEKWRLHFIDVKTKAQEAKFSAHVHTAT